MTTVEFLAYLRSLDVKLSLEAGLLRCNAPKGVMTPALSAELSQRKAEIISILEQSDAAGHRLTLTQPISRKGRFPLSLPQQRLWFVHQLHPSNPAYNLPIAYRITGPLNIEVLGKSINEVIRRHEILRTVFPSVDGQPEQVIVAHVDLSLRQVDLSTLAFNSRDQEVHRLASEHFRLPFDLVHGPLIRPLVLCLNESEHVLLISIHHIVFDGRSLEILMNELAVLYEAFLSGRSSPLADLSVQYADYAIQQQEWLGSSLLEKELLFWKQTLGGVSEGMLPTDLSRPTVQSGNGQQVFFSLSETLGVALKNLGIEESTTLFMTLLASYQVLLHLYSGHEDLIVGIPAANRSRPEIRNMIGFFVNTLTIRVRLSEDLAFREVLTRVRESTLSAYAHSELPFERVVEELRPQRSTASPPLVTVWFAFSNGPLPSPTLGGLKFDPIHVEVGTAKADLTWSLWDTPQGIHGAAEYSTDLFSSETINQLIDDFKKIIQVTAENPDLRIGDLGVRGKRVAEPKQEPWKGIADHAGRFFELTESQLLVWMGQQLEPDVPLYNVPYLFRIRAKVDRGHFDAAFQALVHSTDAMRLVFEEVGGIPRQRAIEDQACHLEHVDFSGHQNPEESFRTWGKVRSQKTIDLGGCPFDSVLAKISETEWFWFLNMHHIATDGWSLILLFQRLQELYRRSVEGRLAKKCPAYPRFLDYISRELAERSSSRDHADETYWSQRLEKGAESVSFYGTAPLKRSSKSRRVSCDLGETRSRELKGMAADPRFHSKSFRASLFNIFLGILAAYLYRISGTRDISVGAPFSNRKSAHAKGVVGLLMAVAPLRVRVEEEDTFLSLIYRARAEAQGASKHSTYSIGNFQAKNYDVVLNSLPMMALTFEDVGVEIDWLHPDRENESLSLHVVVSQKENICIHFDFHCDVFQESQHARAIQHFLKLMDAFLADPGREVERVSLLSPGERRQVLADFNAFDFQPENDTTLQAIFESRVLKTPERPAVCFGSTFLTYSSLNARANQLAHYLKEMGVGPDTVVGLCLDRSPELITGMLGILKAGGAYLPLDPTLPEARLSFMIEDTGTRIILTRDYLLSCLPKNGARLVSLDGEADAIGKQIGNNPSSKIHSDCLAYVMYTSGSTGIPKGVMISHKAICNRLIWEQKQYEMNEHDVVLQYFSPSFDFSVWEIFATLFAGAQLILYTSDANMVDANHIAALMRHHCVTIAGFVPSTLEMLLDERALAGCTSLQHVFCGGEPMSLRLQTEFHASLSARLTNTYGPTEASVDVAHWTCNREESSGNVPIGHPIGNTTLYILDARLEPVPQGVAGELFIGGIGLARGYFNQPALTAERFLPDPFSVGGRLYRTGDLARHRPDGAIEFLGRIDEQIKLRGFRIEPAEVRAALEEHPSVEQAVVLPGDELLLAFVTPWDGASGADLRDFLRTKLPHYMVPSRITRVASFPLTHNGKVDKVALLVHESPGQDRRTVDVLPKGELERTIAIIWKEVLKLDAVSTRESFFDLGGHSLLLAQVHSRLQARLGRTFPLIELFRHPTISTFARYLEEGNAVSSSQIRARARLQVDAIRRQAALSRERRISR